MDIKRSGAQPSGKGPGEYFTAPCASIRCFTHRIRHASSARASRSSRRPDRLAHAPAGPDPHRHVGQRTGPALGRSDRGHPSRRRRVVRAGREALARRRADDGHDAHGHSGAARRKNGRLDGEGQRRTVWAMTSQEKSSSSRAPAAALAKRPPGTSPRRGHASCWAPGASIASSHSPASWPMVAARRLPWRPTSPASIR